MKNNTEGLPQEELAPIGRGKKTLNAVRRFFSNPANIILVVFLLVLVFMIF